MVFESLSAKEIAVVQYPTGNLKFVTTAGPTLQMFGSVSSYNKMSTYEFELPVRFNDGGHGTIFGSINYELPVDKEHLYLLHTKFGSQEAIQKQLVEVVVNKSVYMTGPLMSSKESYAEKRTNLINYIEDQIQNGVYKTLQRDVKTKDPITGTEKTVTVVEITLDDHGIPLRQERSILGEYGIKTSNFAVTKLPYDQTVEDQIKQQQELTMKVQTAQASAREAEQRAITVAKEGEANAAKAKWEQEVIKAKMVTEAQQQLEVATLNAKAAEQTKREQVLLGEGESTRKRLVMQADGGLDPKVQALIKINEVWAAAAAQAGNWVPSVIMGGDGKNSSSVNDLVSLFTASAAKQMGIDMTVSGKAQTTK
ncbi:conserved hypothetical protein [sediment metagenome]|uniref:Band 7 domain-containing protein n=1 Tax=sediment metagenome TaxID=749907 RepID=D9PH61_9ZZZZ